jgi:phosphosulfolactate synthase (CoM biosynthesis protein A)
MLGNGKYELVYANGKAVESLLSKEQTTSTTQSAIESKKADIEKLEKEKQEALQPLIEEKEQIEKEIEEIEKDTKGSLQESDRISSVKKEIANLRNENGEIPANKMGEFNKLSKLLRFLQLSPSLQIERAIQDFIDKNNLTDKQERYIRSLSKIRDSFSEIVQELQDLTSVEFVKSDLMDIVDSNNTSIEKIINDSQDEINETKNKASNIAAKELGIEIEKEYSADELDNFVQKHGSNQTKFIWNLIKNIAQKLGVKTRFSLEGKTTVPNGYAGHYAQGKIDNRATLLQTPDVAARVIVHELVHGVTNYIIDAVKKNRTDVLSLLTQKQINAAKKLSALLKQLQSDSNTKDFYGAKNEDEILAELTHDGFVEALKNKKLNFVEKILDYILDILGVSTNAYEEALGILKDMLENPIDYIDKGFVQSNSLYSQSNTKLDQLKQQLAEVNKKIDEVTKRFDAQIAQKQSELKTLEEASTTQSEIDKKADIEIGKVGNTEYEVKVDGVYYQGKKLNNPENKTHRQLIEADIERRRPTSYIRDSKDKKSSLETFRNEAKREWDGVSVITGDRMKNLYVGIQLFAEAYPEYKELLNKFIKKENGTIGITNNNLSFVLNTLKKQGVTTESELGSKINAKYDAELEALCNLL